MRQSQIRQLKGAPEGNNLRWSGRNAMRQAVVVSDADGEQDQRQFVFSESDRNAIGRQPELIDGHPAQFAQPQFGVIQIATGRDRRRVESRKSWRNGIQAPTI